MSDYEKMRVAMRADQELLLLGWNDPAQRGDAWSRLPPNSRYLVNWRTVLSRPVDDISADYAVVAAGLAHFFVSDGAARAIEEYAADRGVKVRRAGVQLFDAIPWLPVGAYVWALNVLQDPALDTWYAAIDANFGVNAVTTAGDVARELWGRLTGAGVGFFDDPEVVRTEAPLRAGAYSLLVEVDDQTGTLYMWCTPFQSMPTEMACLGRMDLGVPGTCGCQECVAAVPGGEVLCPTCVEAGCRAADTSSSGWFSALDSGDRPGRAKCRDAGSSSSVTEDAGAT